MKKNCLNPCSIALQAIFNPSPAQRTRGQRELCSAGETSRAISAHGSPFRGEISGGSVGQLISRGSLCSAGERARAISAQGPPFRGKIAGPNAQRELCSADEISLRSLPLRIERPYNAARETLCANCNTIYPSELGCSRCPICGAKNCGL